MREVGPNPLHMPPKTQPSNKPGSNKKTNKSRYLQLLSALISRAGCSLKAIPAMSAYTEDSNQLDSFQVPTDRATSTICSATTSKIIMTGRGRLRRDVPRHLRHRRPGRLSPRRRVLLVLLRKADSGESPLHAAAVPFPGSLSAPRLGSSPRRPLPGIRADSRCNRPADQRLTGFRGWWAWASSSAFTAAFTWIRASLGRSRWLLGSRFLPLCDGRPPCSSPRRSLFVWGVPDPLPLTSRRVAAARFFARRPARGPLMASGRG
jgi:hypothetical protein